MTELRFGVAPGAVTALTGTADNRAYWTFGGDLGQMGSIEAALRAAGFDVVKSDVYPGFPEAAKDEYVRALAFVWDRRINGWWSQHTALVEHDICTEAEYDKALRVEAS